jgi:hypothetical protein
MVSIYFVPSSESSSPPTETPSSSNSARILQIQILSEYAKDINRSMYAMAAAGKFHREHVRRALSNLMSAVVDTSGDAEMLQQIYTEGNHSLKPQEINQLLILVDNIVNKNRNPENDFPDSSGGGFQENNQLYDGSINRHQNNNRGNSRMMRNNNSDYYGYGQQPPQQYQQAQQQEEDRPIDLSTNAQLLKEVLENQRNANPTNIQKFLRLFMLDEHTFVNEPNRLHALLMGMFSPVTTQAAFTLFMQLRSKYVQNPLGGMMPNGGSGGIPTYNLGDPQYLMHGGAEGYAARLAYEERREMLEDRRFDKYMRNMMMVNMQKMMGAQTPMIGDPGMYGGMGAIKEDIDEKTGKVIGRSFVPGAVGGGGGMSDGMLRVIGDQNKILLQSQMDQLREMKDMFNSVLRNNQNNQ